MPPTPPEAALAARLEMVGSVLRGKPRPHAEGPPSLIDLMVDLAELVRDRGDHASAWLLCVGLAGAFPTADLVRATRRALIVNDVDNAVIWLLGTTLAPATRFGNASATLRIVTDRPVVDVNFTAKSDLLTGIQRVVREVAARWHGAHEVELVVWTSRGGAYRTLQRTERDRLALSNQVRDRSSTADVGDVLEIVVPWQVPVVLTEVPLAGLSDRLAPIAEFTGSSLRLVGYDCIPVSSAETVPLEEPEKFGRYLELVKFSDRVAGISRTAAAEFEGFRDTLSTQGLVGPEVVTCPLPTTTDHSHPVSRHEVPEGRHQQAVVCIGTVGRRKNQAALIEAAEMLWREGVDFELRLFGHLGSERSPVAGLVLELQQLGRPLFLESGASDTRINDVLVDARCLVFPSLHEGFGLPIVEALSHAVPVITSDFGSAREVAEGQGGLLVDPGDAAALTDALRSLLTDDVLHSRLVAEAKNRPVRTWTQYADELWEALLA